jgi:murein DD-endopeptidase MepM/ murein hydrolase activator NlpD
MVLLLSVLMILSGVPVGVSGGRSAGVPADLSVGVPDGVFLGVSAGVSAGVPSGFSAGVSAGPSAGASAVRVVGFQRAGVAFGWPVEGARVVRRFDPPPQPWLPGHRGADLAAAPGARVRAAGAGMIVFAGEIAGRGVVSVAHPGGLRTTYEPVQAEGQRPGESVAAGEVIGTLAPGHLGCPAAACLHWGLRRGADYFDPLTLLGLGRVRLLPL